MGKHNVFCDERYSIECLSMKFIIKAVEIISMLNFDE